MNIPQATRLLLSGLAAGDSIGSTSEFKNQNGVREFLTHQTGTNWPLEQVGGGAFGWNAGQGTDDTDMAMAIVDAIMAGTRGDDFTDRTARGFIDWYDGGPKDIGRTTRTMLRLVKRRIQDQQTPKQLWNEALDASAENPRAWSNGALMRNGVCAALTYANLHGMVWDSVNDALMRHTLLTHACALPVVCNLVHATFIKRALDPEQRFEMIDKYATQLAYDYLYNQASDAVQSFRSQFGSRDEFHYEVGGSVKLLDEALWPVMQGTWNPFKDERAKFRHQGYCVLTLQVAVWVTMASMDDPRFERHLPEWVPQEVRDLKGAERLAWVGLIGHDSDTYGAAAGPMVAALHGHVPDFLTNNLKALDVFDKTYAAGKI